MLNTNRGTVKVDYSVGDGNRIFQYMYARILSHIHDADLSTIGLKVLGVNQSIIDYNENLPIVKIGKGENNFHRYMEAGVAPSNYLVDTYPEDYTIYKPHLDLIREWITDIPLKYEYENDLVFHLRLGDRLLYQNEYDGDVTYVEDYIRAIEKFKYKRLHIVTDMPKWEVLSVNDLKNMRFHVSVSEKERVKWDIACDYFNSLYKGFSKLDPIVRVGYPVKDDFDFMRSFNQILFKHGTLPWWAATLSHASKVGVYGPWRLSKGDRNKNLGQTDFDGWLQWGLKNGD